MATPHINAEKKQIAKTVLMPGDPMRAKFIAENFLENTECYNTVRGMLGYTGFYKGKRISVQGSGMGMPSIGIYSHELFSEYDVDTIIRIGSAGAISEKVKIRDIVVGVGACTNSNFAHQFDLPGVYAPIADFSLLEKASQLAKEQSFECHFGNILSSDTFYDASNSLAKWRKLDVLAVEMEAAALYMNAALFSKKALAILTISDAPLTDEPPTTAEEREKTFLDMMKLALELAE